MRYYHLEQFSNNGWITTGVILGGDFHEHIKLMEKLQSKHNIMFRAKNISQQTANYLWNRGMKLFIKREKTDKS